MKKFPAWIALASVLLTCFGCTSAGQNAGTPTTGQSAALSTEAGFPAKLSPETFTDPLLLEAASKADTDDDGILSWSEAIRVETLHLKKFPEDPDGLEDAPRPTYTAEDFCIDLNGIFYFPALKELTINMQGGEFFVKDAPENINAVTRNFEQVYCLAALENLSLCEIDIPALNLSAFPALTTLELADMYQLESLKCNTAGQLTSLWLCDCHKLADLDLLGAGALDTLNIISCRNLANIRFADSNQGLKILQLNQLPCLLQVDFTALTDLQKLDIFHTALDRIDVSRNKELEQFCAEGLQLDTLDLQNNPKISYIINHGDSFQKILLPDDNQVTMIRWTNSKITEFPISNLNPDTLEGIDIQGTAIPELDIRPYPNIQYLYYDEDVTTIIK